ncbi:Uncharacterised protein [uncultured archaeon]|nr:Uncharacterised protein [uncultured archaeon]
MLIAWKEIMSSDTADIAIPRPTAPKVNMINTRATRSQLPFIVTPRRTIAPIISTTALASCNTSW